MGSSYRKGTQHNAKLTWKGLFGLLVGVMGWVRRQYEIDLSTANAEKLREALRPFAAAGRRARGKSARASASRASSGGNPETAKVRAWAQGNGYEVSDRGRIPQEIREAYYTATQ